ncbi:MAG: hypothetical protein WAM97_19205 [Acidimicrobiales bacterium]
MERIGSFVKGLWRPKVSYWLLLLCVVPPIVETAIVLLLIPGSAPTLAPQASAVAPFGVFHDLRWLSVYANSWLTFGLLAGATLVVRGVLTALSVRLAWPATTSPPAVGKLMLRGVGSTTFAAVLLAPSVALLFALAVVPVSWLFLAGAPLALGIAVVVHPIAISGGWWKRAIPLRAIGWVAMSFFVMTVAAGVVAWVPHWVDFVVDVVVGVFNARAWVGMVGAVVEPRHVRGLVPAVPAALAVMVAIVALGSVNGFTHVNPRNPGGVSEAFTSVAARGERAVLVVAGYGSHWNGKEKHPVPGSFFEVQFSYSGLGPSGQPLPYTSAETVKPLKVLDAEMAQQVAKLHEESGDRVDIVAESEGALVAATYLVSFRHAPVSTVVLASPLIDPGRVSYPVRSSSVGFGVASRYAMHLLGSAYQSVAPIDLNPESAFLESVNRLAPLLQQVIACPVAGVRKFAFLPLADATAAPVHITLPFHSVVVSAFHGGLVGSPPTDRLIAQVLEDKTPAGSGVLHDLDTVIAASSAAWQVPSLALSSYSRVIPAHQTLVSTCNALAEALKS